MPLPVTHPQTKFTKAEVREMSAAIDQQLAEQRAAATAKEKARREEAARRVPKPSEDFTRYSRSRGQAHLRGNRIPPVWLLDGIESVRATYDAWQAENATGAELAAIADEARAAFEGLSVRSAPGAPLQRAMAVRVEEYADAEAAVAGAEAAADAQSRRALSALHAFDDLAHSRDIDTERRALAATQALVFQEEVLAAWAALTVALDKRDVAYHYAGAPGTAWTEQGRLGANVTRTDGGWSDAERITSARVNGFPVAAVEAVKGA